ncbi:thiamine pyrophosphate-binding protein [Nitrospirillum sp. BR 11163]|uniref:thiamine pyrophosphate-binding protein n=1 Tax=Nitrospirillum sp. BR 11163 TaxID=3104323 RepID=UPI002AFFFB05|nr:thiamine pyrophosphate-binding protein [Nitrospirillum sp. BR 11163]MEA1672779.1 thiamine pyrophosphate-binding protein [Nitrospirillum sp. BR 11163]
MANKITTTVSGLIIALLKKYEVKRVFGLPSAQLGIFMDGVSKDPYFTYVTSRHEECAGHMAHGATIPNNEMAVCFGTVGPGATNLLPGVAAAWADNIPMLVLTPDNPLWMLDPYVDMLQCVDQIALFKPVTKWSAMIREPSRAGELIERAIRMARQGRPGPVHLDLPVDVSAMEVTYDLDAIPAALPPRPVPSKGELDEVVKLLRGAKRPLLVAGGGVVRSGGTQAFRMLADRTGFPAISTVQGWGVIDPNSAGYIGSPGWHAGHAVIEAGRNADVILAVGCKFGSWTPVAKPPAVIGVDGQKIIQVDIDYEMIGKNAPVALGLLGDARETLVAINALLGSDSLSINSSWLPSLSDVRKTYLDSVNSLADARPDDGSPIATPAFMRELARILPKDAIACLDGGQTSSWAMTFIDADQPGRAKFESGMGHMGAGLPMAIGAKVAAGPDQLVVVISADGSAGLTGQEMETAARLGIKVIMFVFNDSCWGCYKPLQDFVFRNPNWGTTVSNVDFSVVAKSYGCDGERITKPEEISEAFKRGLASQKPYVIDVQTSYAFHPLDPVFFGQVVTGNIQLKPHALATAA